MPMTREKLFMKSDSKFLKYAVELYPEVKKLHGRMDVYALAHKKQSITVFRPVLYGIP